MADVGSLIDDARSYAASTIGSAQAELQNASSPLQSLGGLTVTPALVQPALPAPFIPATPPQLTPIALENFAEPGSPPAPQNIPDPLDGIGDTPVLTATPLSFVDPQLPSQLAAFTGLLPAVNTNFSFPPPPDLLMNPTFSPPVLPDRVAPTAPDVLLPEFLAISPGAPAAPPDDYAQQFTAAYSEFAPSMYSALDGQMNTLLTRFNPRFNEQMTALEDRLATYIAGGTGLTPAVENAIYERTKDKVNADYRRVRDVAFGDAAKRGFTIPDGALLSSIQQARQSGSDNLTRASSDIAVKQAELEQQNIQFAVTTSANLRVSMMSAMISYYQGLVNVNGQALDAAKAVLSALIEVYNSMVKNYSLQIESFKADAEVYDVKLRAAMAGITLYQAEIAALEALERVDVTKVEAYKAEVESLVSLAAVYRSQIDAVIAQASLEKLKIELFGAQVQAYTAQTQAKSSEFQGYAAAINGEEAKTRVYAEQVQAYSTEVAAWKAKVEAKAEQSHAIALNNQSRATTYASLISAYNARVDAGAKKVTSEIEFGKELIQEYAVANQAAIASAQVQSDLFRTQTQVAIETNKLNSTKLLEEARIKLEAAKAISTNSIQAADVYGHLASSALAGMNTLVTQSSTQ